jgi:hypothetical protein
MLRLVLKDITITKAAKTVTLQLRWHGGATEELRVPLRPKASDQWRHDPALVERVRELAQHANDERIVEHLNQAGVKTRKGNRLTVSAIRWIRFKHAIPVPTLKRPEERTVPEVAAHFGVSPHVIYYWIERHHITGRKLANPKGVAWFLTLDQETEHRLWQWVEQSTRMTKHSTSQTLIAGGAL